MANKIATFKFDAKSNYEGYIKATEQLKSNLGRGGWDTESDGGIFSSINYYFIKINSDIKDAGKAGDICRVHGGKPY